MSNITKTLKEFLKDSKRIHGDKYNYSKVNYINNHTKIIIICPIHGEFFQAPYTHLHGHGCNKCKINAQTLTTEKFIQKAKKIHGNKYDYSNVKYNNTNTPVIIICKEHGEFEQLPVVHLRGGGCKKCWNNSRKSTTNEFIQKSNIIHNNKFTYSKVNYINNSTDVTITCLIHGDFIQTPRDHLSGKGCSKCKFDKQRSTTEDFIQKAKKIHGNKYDYSNVDYITSDDKIIITCNKHGDFKQLPRIHLQGSGCQKCTRESRRLSQEEFIKRSNKIHNFKYKDGYEKVKYTNCYAYVNIVCPEHGEFKQQPKNHMKGNGCPICNYSHGEREIYNFLKTNNIDFISQHIFDNCLGDYKQLIFDFFIPSKNMLIEYDGEQHYKYTPGIHKDISVFKRSRRYDQIKDNYALKNNITLIRIRYDESIEDKLKSIFNFAS